MRHYPLFVTSLLAVITVTLAETQCPSHRSKVMCDLVPLCVSGYEAVADGGCYQCVNKVTCKPYLGRAPAITKDDFAAKQVCRPEALDSPDKETCQSCLSPHTIVHGVAVKAITAQLLEAFQQLHDRVLQETSIESACANAGALPQSHVNNYGDLLQTTSSTPPKPVSEADISRIVGSLSHTISDLADQVANGGTSASSATATQRCSDNTEPTCGLIPSCPVGKVAAVRNYCYACVDPKTCIGPPLNDAGNIGSSSGNLHLGVLLGSLCAGVAVLGGAVALVYRRRKARYEAIMSMGTDADKPDLERNPFYGTTL